MSGDSVCGPIDIDNVIDIETTPDMDPSNVDAARSECQYRCFREAECNFFSHVMILDTAKCVMFRSCDVMERKVR